MSAPQPIASPTELKVEFIKHNAHRLYGCISESKRWNKVGKAKRCFQCPLLHPPSSPLSWSRIGLLGRGGCVIVFPANVCKSASAGARAASVPFDWCSVTWEMTGAWQSVSLGKAYRGGEIRSGGSRLSCVGRVLFQLPAAGPLSHPGWDPEGRGSYCCCGFMKRPLCRLSSSCTPAPEDRGAFMIDVYIQGFSLNVTE